MKNIIHPFSNKIKERVKVFYVKHIIGVIRKYPNKRIRRDFYKDKKEWDINPVFLDRSSKKYLKKIPLTNLIDLTKLLNKMMEKDLGISLYELVGFSITFIII
jgi:hypothetical protein